MHATIFENDGVIKLKDIGSTNGTYLNGIMLYEDAPVELQPGDIIRFGKIETKFK